jgi:N-methylhydantoinase A
MRKAENWLRALSSIASTITTMRLAIDIGGTFTDLVAIDAAGEVSSIKALTTPDDHVRGIQDCLASVGIQPSQVEVLAHGSTTAINTVIERTGARAGLITTAGFRDVYEIGRGNRPDAYNLHFRRPEPLIPRERRVEVVERVSAQGQVLKPLDDTSLETAIRQLEEQHVESVAVCLLHAYANPTHEQRIGAALTERHPEWFVSLSHEVLREMREYERTSTTALNAYIAPVVARYVGNLEALLHSQGFKGQLLIMQSNGGVMSAATARRMPVAMMESGPVAGVMGAAAVGKLLGYPDVISFDMGGTTAKTSLVRGGVLEVTTNYYIGGYATGQPMGLPVVDIVEVGAGGGSIAWVDGAGALKVGPRSAGALPGPASFGRGGDEPTVTDANVVLGRIDTADFVRLGGGLSLQPELAERAVARIAEPFGMSLVEAALGIVTIADANMALALRAVSVERGRDPRDFALVLSGGGGPLHGLSLARALGIPVVIVPQRASVFSAEGLLRAPLRHDYVQTALSELAQVDLTALASRFAEMETQAGRTLAQEGAPPEAIRFSRFLDLRYVGQDHTLPLPVVNGPAESPMRQAFDALHLERYGHHAPGEPVEVVNLRLRAEAEVLAAPRTGVGTGQGPFPFGESSPSGGVPPSAGVTRPIVFARGAEAVQCPVYVRSELPEAAEVHGPAVISEYGSVTLLYPGDVATVAAEGHLVVRVA